MTTSKHSDHVILCWRKWSDLVSYCPRWQMVSKNDDTRWWYWSNLTCRSLRLCDKNSSLGQLIIKCTSLPEELGLGLTQDEWGESCVVCSRLESCVAYGDDAFSERDTGICDIPDDSPVGADCNRTQKIVRNSWNNGAYWCDSLYCRWYANCVASSARIHRSVCTWIHCEAWECIANHLARGCHSRLRSLYVPSCLKPGK